MGSDLVTNAVLGHRAAAAAVCANTAAMVQVTKAMSRELAYDIGHLCASMPVRP